MEVQVISYMHQKKQLYGIVIEISNNDKTASMGIDDMQRNKHGWYRQKHNQSIKNELLNTPAKPAAGK